MIIASHKNKELSRCSVAERYVGNVESFWLRTVALFEKQRQGPHNCKMERKSKNNRVSSFIVWNKQWKCVLDLCDSKGCIFGSYSSHSNKWTLRFCTSGMRHILKSKIQEYYMRREKYETSYREVSCIYLSFSLFLLLYNILNKLTF